MTRAGLAVERTADHADAVQVYRNGSFEIDFAGRRVCLDGEPVKLSRTEYDLLHALAQRAGQAMTCKSLLKVGWDATYTDVQYLRVYIGLIRRKIETDPANPRLLLNEPGGGFRLASPA